MDAQVQKIDRDKTESLDIICQIQKKQNEYLVQRGSAILHLKHGEDYGPPWPGSKKDCLLLSGSDKINALMNVYVYPQIDTMIRDIDFDQGFYCFQIMVELRNKDTHKPAAYGLGICHSQEDKYRFRNASYKCPDCDKETIKISKWAKDNPQQAFYCYQKIGGCGAKFSDDNESITGQEVGKVERSATELLNDLHTYSQMAIKRAQIKATRSMACISDVFSQDWEDKSREVILVKSEQVDEKQIESENKPKPSVPTAKLVYSDIKKTEIKRELKRNVSLLAGFSNSLCDDVMKLLLQNNDALFDHIDQCESNERIQKLEIGLEKSIIMLAEEEWKTGEATDNA